MRYIFDTLKGEIIVESQGEHDDEKAAISALEKMLSDYASSYRSTPAGGSSTDGDNDATVELDTAIENEERAKMRKLFGKGDDTLTADDYAESMRSNLVGDDERAKIQEKLRAKPMGKHLIAGAKGAGV